ncbi:MAG: hypothetical protein PHS02_04700 [Candidatus ainarchaeum sp.]|nr:hypothetical protein [Candidatus ainarchaeum sp.]
MRYAIPLILAFLIFCGCLDLQPQPLNETGFLPPIPNSTHQGTTSPISSGPLQCSMAVNGSNITIRMDGMDIRSDYLSPELNNTIITIIKGDSYYISGNALNSSCDWLYLNTSAFKSQNYETNVTALPDFGMPELGSCSPGTFGQEIFEINGSVCDFMESMDITG